MINYIDLHRWAVDVLVPNVPSEAGVRRAVSSLYYGLFHHLTGSGAGLFAAGPLALQERVARTHDHGQMRRVCKAFVTWASQPSNPPYDFLAGAELDPRVEVVASAFDQLQEARHAADYDLNLTFPHAYGLELMERAEAAHWNLEKLDGTPEQLVFLTALLLGDRLRRRG